MDKSMDKVLQNALDKVKSGRKLTRKEKKKYDDYMKTIPSKIDIPDLDDTKDLEDFTLMTESKTNGGKDIVLKNFSIVVKGKTLLKDTKKLMDN